MILDFKNYQNLLLTCQNLVMYWVTFPLKIRDVEVPSLLDDSFSEIVVSPSTLDFSISDIICKQLLLVRFDIV